MLGLVILAGAIGMLIGALLGQSHERMLWQRRLLERVGLVPDESSKLAESLSAARETSDDPKRLAQALDALAVEVERIGEGQRFLTRVMAERNELRSSGRSTSPLPNSVKAPTPPTA